MSWLRWRWARRKAYRSILFDLAVIGRPVETSWLALDRWLVEIDDEYGREHVPGPKWLERDAAQARASRLRLRARLGADVGGDGGRGLLADLPLGYEDDAFIQATIEKVRDGRLIPRPRGEIRFPRPGQ